MQTSTFDVNLHQSEFNEKCKSVKAPNHVDVIIDLDFGVGENEDLVDVAKSKIDDNEISFIASFSVSPANAVTLTSSGWEN